MLSSVPPEKFQASTSKWSTDESFRVYDISLFLNILFPTRHFLNPQQLLLQSSILSASDLELIN